MTDANDLDFVSQLDLVGENWVSTAEKYLGKQSSVERFWVSSRKEKFLSIDFNNINAIPSYVKWFDGLEVRISNSIITDNFIGDNLSNCRHLWFVECEFESFELAEHVRNVEYLLFKDCNYEIWNDDNFQNYSQLKHISITGDFQIDYFPIFNLQPMRPLNARKSITVEFQAFGIAAIRKTAAIYRLAECYSSLRSSKWEITLFGKGDQFNILSKNRYNRSRSDKSCTFYLHELLDIVTSEFIE